MTFPSDIIEAVARAYCNATEVHLRCSFPQCACKGATHGVPAVLAKLTALNWSPASAAVKEEREACAKVIAAAKRLIGEGLRGTWDSNGRPIQAVIEKEDGSDAHYQLCEALEELGVIRSNSRSALATEKGK